MLLVKSIFRIARITSNVDNVLITITLGAGVTGAALLATVVAAPVVLGLVIGAAATGLISLSGNIVVKKTTIKAEKHLKINMLAKAKLDTIATHISEALMDNKISDDEFKLIMEELNKYKAMKEEIQSNMKKIKEEKEASLVRGGGKKRRSPFGCYLKRKLQGVRFKGPKVKIPRFRCKCVCEIGENHD